MGRAQRAEGAVTDPTKKSELQKAERQLQGAKEHMAYLADTLAPTSKDLQCKSTLERAGKALEQAAANTLQNARVCISKYL